MPMSFGAKPVFYKICAPHLQSSLS